MLTVVVTLQLNGLVFFPYHHKQTLTVKVRVVRLSPFNLKMSQLKQVSTAGILVTAPIPALKIP